MFSTFIAYTIIRIPITSVKTPLLTLLLFGCDANSNSK